MRAAKKQQGARGKYKTKTKKSDKFPEEAKGNEAEWLTLTNTTTCKRTSLHRGKWMRLFKRCS